VRLGRAGRGVVVRVGYGRYYGGLAKGLGKRCGSGREREGGRGKGTSVEVSFPPGRQRGTEPPGWFGVCDAFARDQVAYQGATGSRGHRGLELLLDEAYVLGEGFAAQEARAQLGVNAYAAWVGEPVRGPQAPE
jgi:hypothetical protein